MRMFLTTATVVALAATMALSQRSANPFLGRWDMTATRGDLTFPSWLEVTEKNGQLAARVQLRTGNVFPVAAAKLDGSKLLLTVSNATPARPAEGERPAVPARPPLTWELTASGGKLSGTQTQGQTSVQLAGVRAPDLRRAAPQAWNPPEPLFNGKDLTGWQPINNTGGDPKAPFKSCWAAKDGELVNECKAANIRTARTFDDFKLHIEWLCPPGENSGIYLRGRYEVQIAPPPDPNAPAPPKPPARPGVYRNPYGGVASIYGMIGPSKAPKYRPDWQTYDITLVGRNVTLVFNGETLIDNQEIPGITGGALDSNEAEPGPIYFQGDHHGGIRYRNITISTPKR